MTITGTCTAPDTCSANALVSVNRDGVIDDDAALGSLQPDGIR